MLILNPVKKLKKFLPKKVITQPILSIMSKKEEKKLQICLTYFDFSTVLKQRKILRFLFPD
jgi:hypothetical protein